VFRQASAARARSGIVIDTKASRPAPAIPRHRRTVTTGLRWLVALGLLALLLYLTDLRRVGSLLSSATPWLVMAALGAALLDRGLMFAKWYPLLKMQNASISPGIALRAYLAAGFAGIFLPSSVGGDMLRSVALGRAGGRVIEIGASVAAERLLGLLSLVLVCCAAVALGVARTVPMSKAMLGALLGVLSVTAFLLLVPANASARRRLSALAEKHAHRPGIVLARRFGVAYALYRKRPLLLGTVGVLSILEQGFPILVIWLVSQALPHTVGILNLVIAVPLAAFVSRIPISAAGIGVGEGMLVYLLTLQEIPAAEALAIAILARAVELGAHAPGALFWHSLGRGPTAGATT